MWAGAQYCLSFRDYASLLFWPVITHTYFRLQTTTAGDLIEVILWPFAHNVFTWTTRIFLYYLCPMKVWLYNTILANILHSRIRESLKFVPANYIGTPLGVWVTNILAITTCNHNIISAWRDKSEITKQISFASRTAAIVSKINTTLSRSSAFFLVCLFPLDCNALRSDQVNSRQLCLCSASLECLPHCAQLDRKTSPPNPPISKRRQNNLTALQMTSAEYFCFHSEDNAKHFKQYHWLLISSTGQFHDPFLGGWLMSKRHGPLRHNKRGVWFSVQRRALLHASVSTSICTVVLLLTRACEVL